MSGHLVIGFRPLTSCGSCGSGLLNQWQVGDFYVGSSAKDAVEGDNAGMPSNSPLSDSMENDFLDIIRDVDAILAPALEAPPIAATLDFLATKPEVGQVAFQSTEWQRSLTILVLTSTGAANSASRPPPFSPPIRLPKTATCPLLEAHGSRLLYPRGREPPSGSHGRCSIPH